MMYWPAIPPSLEDVEWIGRITGLDKIEMPDVWGEPRDAEGLPALGAYELEHQWVPFSTPPTLDRLGAELAVQDVPTEMTAAPPSVSPRRSDWMSVSTEATWNYTGCLRDQGYSCGPAFDGGPLAGGHAHGSPNASIWPGRYGAASGWYVLTGATYRWTTPDSGLPM